MHRKTMSVFDQSLNRVIPITYESLKEDGWEQIPLCGISHDILWPIYGRYEKSFNDGAISCTLVVTINHNNELVYKLSFYDNIDETVYSDCTELTYMDGIDIILKKYGII